MRDITLNAGTDGNSLEFTLSVPRTVEEYKEKGYSDEAIEEMLCLDLRRKLAVVVRQDMASDKPSSYEELKAKLEGYVYKPGRKSSQGSKAVQEGRKQAWEMMSALSDEEVLALRRIPQEDKDAMSALPSVADMKKAIQEATQ